MHIFHNIMFMLKRIYRVQKSFLYICFSVHAIKIITPITSVLGLKLILDALTKKVDFSYVISVVMAYCLLNITNGVVNSWYNDAYLPVVTARISKHMDIELMQRITKLELKKFDSSEFYSMVCSFHIFYQYGRNVLRRELSAFKG